MKNGILITFCVVALLASTQTSGLLRSLIELSAFIGVLWWVLTTAAHKK